MFCVDELDIYKYTFILMINPQQYSIELKINTATDIVRLLFNLHIPEYINHVTRFRS